VGTPNPVVESLADSQVPEEYSVAEVQRLRRAYDARSTLKAAAAQWRKSQEDVEQQQLGSSRWWFQILFIFTPTWANDPIWQLGIMKGNTIFQGPSFLVSIRQILKVPFGRNNSWIMILTGEIMATENKTFRPLIFVAGSEIFWLFDSGRSGFAWIYVGFAWIINSLRQLRPSRCGCTWLIYFSGARNCSMEMIGFF